MNNLNQFTRFDAAAFLAGKKLQYVDQSNWVDHDSGALLGTRVDLVIIEDKTSYKAKADGTPARTNRFEKLTVKVPGAVSLPEDAMVELVNPTGTVWGEYRNQLSLKADEVREIAPAAVAKPAPKPTLPRQ